MEKLGALTELLARLSDQAKRPYSETMRHTETRSPPIGLPAPRTRVRSHCGRSALRFLRTHHRFRTDRLLEFLHSNHRADRSLSDHQHTAGLRSDHLSTGARVRRMDLHRLLVHLFLFLRSLDVRAVSGRPEGVRQRIDRTEPVPAGAAEQRDRQIEKGDGILELEAASQNTDRTAALQFS